jgi:circadian clock protein KaiC
MKKSRPGTLKKCPTGIAGLDDITRGGLPRGRASLVCGPAGCGKTLLGMEFIVHGITKFDEPGVFMAFEETGDELAVNVASLGIDLDKLIRQKKMAVDYVYIERHEIEETGEYDLEGLFVRLGSMIDGIGAKRVVLDTIEALFAGLPNEAILRAELRRLFRWLKKKGVTAIVTGEQGERHLTRYGLEEYVSDCVIVLDHRVYNQMATRRLRVIKYRGSAHGTNEYPTMIDETGLSVLPISSLGLTYPVSTARIPTGIPRLDMMLGAGGYYRGSSILISGQAGTGKTSVAQAFADGVCKRGEKCLCISLEEAEQQVIRNMRSIGFDLAKWAKKDLMKFYAVRPTLYGLETHLVTIHKLVDDFKPAAVVIDPVTNMHAIGELTEIKAMLTRLIDFLKNRQITALFTGLTNGGMASEHSEVGISSLMDTWIILRNVETDGERNRLLHILKSRGMAHSNQVREFILSDKGISLQDVYVGPGVVLTGSARVVQEAKDRSQELAEQQTLERRQLELHHRQMAIQAQIESLKAESEGLNRELGQISSDARQRASILENQKKRLSRSRKADAPRKEKSNAD